MLKYVAVTFLLLVAINVHAQSWEMGAMLGGSGYSGDLNTNNPLKVSGIAAGFFLKRNVNRYLSFKLGYTYGTITAADSTSSNAQFRARNLSFSTVLNELAFTGEFNFMEYTPSVTQNVYTPFIFGGIAYTYYTPKAEYQGQIYNLRSLETGGQSKPYGNSTWALPYGAGIKYNFSGRTSLIGEIGYRFAFTDYLDDVSGVYPDRSKLPSALSKALSDRSGEQTGIYTGTPGTQRGDNRSHDNYMFVGFSISYTFVTSKCYY